MDWSWVSARIEASAGHPRALAEAYRLIGTHEGDGRVNNSVIMGWVEELAHVRASIKQFHNDHEQAWCGLFAAHCMHYAGYAIPMDPLWALTWSSFGVPSPKAAFGDILVFKRTNAKGVVIGGHVGFYVGESTNRYWVLGGNESDAVRIAPEPKSRWRATRRAPYGVTPSNVLPVLLKDDGSPSQSEV